MGFLPLCGGPAHPTELRLNDMAEAGWGLGFEGGGEEAQRLGQAAMVGGDAQSDADGVGDHGVGGGGEGVTRDQGESLGADVRDKILPGPEGRQSQPDMQALRVGGDQLARQNTGGQRLAGHRLGADAGQDGGGGAVPDPAGDQTDEQRRGHHRGRAQRRGYGILRLRWHKEISQAQAGRERFGGGGDVIGALRRQLR